MIGKTRGAVITVGFFFDWVVLKGLIMSSFSIVFISRLASFFLDKVRCTALVCKNSND